MNHFQITHDKTSGLWSLRDVNGGGAVMANRLTVDTPCKTVGRGLSCTGVLNADELSSIASKGAVVNSARVMRGTPLPGRVNDPPMEEWVVVFDEGTELWAVYRQDMQSVVVTAREIELDCHAITSEGRLHCRAEMLVNGRTNKIDSFLDAGRVQLRTLCVYDQRVSVPIIRAKSIAKAPG